MSINKYFFSFCLCLSIILLILIAYYNTDLFKTGSGSGSSIAKTIPILGEKFMNIPLGASSDGPYGLGFKKISSDNPLFANFYAPILGSDFKLNSTIRKLKLESNSPTILNGLKVGAFTSVGLGQVNLGPRKAPVFIIPTIGASTIYAQWSKPNGSTMSAKKLDAYGNFQETTKWSCKDTEDSWTKIWFPGETSSLSKYCWVDNVSVRPTSNEIVNNPGISTELSNMGSLDFETKIYDVLITALYAMSYVQGTTLFGASYDHRLIASDSVFEGYKRSLTSLIETSVSNNKKRAILIGHGLGAVVMNKILVSMPRSWLENNIESFFVVSGTFGGVPKALRVLMSGESLPDPQDQQLIRNATLNFSGLHMMLPRPEVYSKQKLVSYKQNEYTASDIPVLLKKVSEDILHNNDVVDTYNLVSKDTDYLKAPQVPVYIFAGVNVPTESSYNYDSLIDDPAVNYPSYGTDSGTQSEFAFDQDYNGDGTVPKFVLEFPLSWAQQQTQSVQMKFYERAEHSKIMMMNEPVSDLLEIIKILNA
jgi:hypothetical protein